MQSIYPDRQNDLTLWRLAHLLQGADPLADIPTLPVQNELMSLAGAILNNELRVVFKDSKRVDFIKAMSHCKDGQFPKADLEGIYIRRQDWDAYTNAPLRQPEFTGSEATEVAHLKAEVERLQMANRQLEQEIVDLKSKANNQGKNIIEDKAKILAAALHVLADNPKAVRNDNGTGPVNATKLADKVNDYRHRYGFQEEKPAYSTILRRVREALFNQNNSE